MRNYVYLKIDRKILILWLRNSRREIYEIHGMRIKVNSLSEFKISNMMEHE